MNDKTGTVPSESAIQVDLRQVVYALADALDLVGIDDLAHGKRVGIMAAACAQHLAWSQARQDFLFDLGLLHDIGVSSTRTHQHLVAEFDWASSQAHCLLGEERLLSFPAFIPFALPVRLHHTPWSVLAGQHDWPAQACLDANLIYLVDRVDALSAAYRGAGENLLLHTPAIRSAIAARSGAYFAPELVEAFLAVSSSEAFWLQMEPRGIGLLLQERLAQAGEQPMTLDDLKQLARLFSRIVDAKSPFTAEHSHGVASLARYLGERAGLPWSVCEKLEIAGWLHDLGKLRVPDEVLDKPAPLDQAERQVMNTHSFETYQILRHIHGLEEITRWAAYHHEEPDGHGYPFRLGMSEQPFPARLLRVADIVQALVQDRPYRKGLDQASLIEVLQGFLARGRIEIGIYALLEADWAGVIRAARPDLSAV